MMNEQVFASVFRSNKTKSFIRVKPLNRSFAHNAFNYFAVNESNVSLREFTVSGKEF